MSMLSVKVACPNDAPLLVPTGTTTPQTAITGLTVSGGRITRILQEAELGLGAVEILPHEETVSFNYAMEMGGSSARYPEAAFLPRDTLHTRAATDLAAASRDIAARAGGGADAIAALVAEAEARFAYAHPEVRFTEGKDAVPHLACGLTEGSCVDINTYLVASLRAAGFEATYLYGYFFPQERGGMTDDGHCWVATRHAGEVLEWDIAHHLKAGLGATRPSLNPRPGSRVAVTHSMGHRYATSMGAVSLKLLGEPMRLTPGGAPEYVNLTARLHDDLALSQTKGAA